jgi:hypothetical protein
MIVIMIIGVLIGRYVLFRHVSYAGPNSNNVRKFVYKIADGQYIKYDIEMCVCPPSAKNLYKEKMKKEI